MWIIFVRFTHYWYKIKAYLNTVRFLDGEHFTVLLGGCYCHHIFLDTRLSWQISLIAINIGGFSIWRSIDLSVFQSSVLDLMALTDAIKGGCKWALHCRSREITRMNSSCWFTPRDFNIPMVMSSCVLFGLKPCSAVTVRLQQTMRTVATTSLLYYLSPLLDRAYERMRLRGGLPSHINVASLHRLLMPGSGVPPPYRRFGWSIGSSRRHHYCRRQRRRRRRPRRCCHWWRPRGGSSFDIFVILTGFSWEIAFLSLNDTARNVPLSRRRIERNLREINPGKQEISNPTCKSIDSF